MDPLADQSTDPNLLSASRGVTQGRAQPRHAGNGKVHVMSVERSYKLRKDSFVEILDLSEDPGQDV